MPSTRLRVSHGGRGRRPAKYMLLLRLETPQLDFEYLQLPLDIGGLFRHRRIIVS